MNINIKIDLSSNLSMPMQYGIHCTGHGLSCSKFWICCTTAKLWYLSILIVMGILYRLWIISQSGDYIWQYQYTAIRICTTKELHRNELAVVYCLCSLTITLTSPLHTLVLEWRWICSSTFNRCKWLIYVSPQL